MSKGSGRRPQQVSREEYERRWAETFGRLAVSAKGIAEAWAVFDKRRPQSAEAFVAGMAPNVDALPQADGDDGGDDYAVERAGA